VNAVVTKNKKQRYFFENFISLFYFAQCAEKSKTKFYDRLQGGLWRGRRPA
jgi:hypothetical protein